ncbi:ABC transporter substrate-binding protein [Brachybacterium endophyticum]|uniref:ABC transporter substrate-binding protein n=1 Tax=Brachybacterium endophyticum TaxID=2182385 RepID=UPI0014035F2D|nr:extracellular solute-binding protein [Brachybacterium endophyticum]
MTTLRMWHYYQDQQKTWLEDEVRRFEAKHPKTRIALIDVVGDQQAQKLLASVSIGNGPDLLMNNIVVDFPVLRAAGVLKDITEQWESFQDNDQFPEATAWRNEGRVFNLLPYTNLIGMYAHSDALADSGVETVPSTLSELESAMQKVSEKGAFEPLAMAGSPDVEGAWLFAPQLLGLGIDYCNFHGAAVEDAFRRLARWRDKGWLPQATATWSQTDAWQQFMTGRYAFALNGNWNLGNARDSGFAIQTARYPASDGGKSKVYPGGEGIAIGAQTKYPDLAWSFIESAFLSAPGARAVNTVAGSIPVRADVASSDQLAGDADVAPFVEAARHQARWPDNERTADMQRALGEAVSGVISGQLSGDEGASSAVNEIAAARADGGGSC